MAIFWRTACQGLTDLCPTCVPADERQWLAGYPRAGLDVPSGLGSCISVLEMHDPCMTHASGTCTIMQCACASESFWFGRNTPKGLLLTALEAQWLAHQRALKIQGFPLGGGTRRSGSGPLAGRVAGQLILGDRASESLRVSPRALLAKWIGHHDCGHSTHMYPQG